MSSQANTTQQQFIRLTDLTKRIGVSGSSVWAWVKNGTFPAPIKLSPNCTAWTAESVEKWAADRIADSRKAGM